MSWWVEWTAIQATLSRGFVIKGKTWSCDWKEKWNQGCLREKHNVLMLMNKPRREKVMHERRENFTSNDNGLARRGGV